MTTESTANGTRVVRGTTAKGRRWIALVCGLILLNVSICTVTVIAARRSRPPVEAAYDAKALQWDDSASQRNVNRSLGWTSRVSVEVGAGLPRLVVALLDSSGRPIRTASVVASVENTDAAVAPVALTLESNGAGKYVAELPNSAGGWWRVDLAADAGGVRFTDSTRVRVNHHTALGARSTQ